MKILRVFGAVVGIHVFAFLFLLANPGCSSTGKPAPAPADTVAKNESSPTVSLPTSSSGSGSATSPLTPAPLAGDASTVSFNSTASAGVRYSPTRPGTPAAAALEVQPVADVMPAKPYTVLAGENLTTVAKKNKLTIAELAAANNLKPSSTLRQGQKLIIPGKTSVTAPAATTASAPAHTAMGDAIGKSGSETMKHTVKAGETLGAIAQKYGVKQKDLGVLNNITDPKKIRPGQDLIIPAASATAAKPAVGSASTTPSASAPKAERRDASAPTPIKPAAESKPLFNIPPPGQDLDAGLKPAPANDVPVIRIEEAPATAPKK